MANTQSTSASWLNVAIEAVMDLIDEMGNFAPITRGALGIDEGLCCEVAPSNAPEVYYDKNAYFAITLALNGKHHNLQTLSDTLNGIMDTLTRRTTYPYGNGFEIVDITNGIMPRVIGREQNNAWLMACDIIVKIYRKENEPA
jgi:hypothetical protein